MSRTKGISGRWRICSCQCCSKPRRLGSPVSESVTGRHRLRVEALQSDGQRATAEGEFDTVHDVALDEKGRVYLADRENRRVQIINWTTRVR